MMNKEVSPYEDYFTNHKHPPKQLTKSMQTLNLQTMIGIEQGDIKINDKHIHEKCLKTSQQDKKSNINIQVKQIKKMKNHLLDDLSEIYEKQQKLRTISLKQKLKIHRNPSHKLQRSYITLEQKKNILKALKNQQEYQESLNKRLQKLNEIIEAEDKKIQQQIQFEKQALKKKRKLKIKQKRYQTQQLKSEPPQLKKSAIKRNQAYAYIIQQKKDLELQKQRQKYNTLILKQKKNRMQTDFSSIRQHSIDHDHYIQEKRQEFQKCLKINMMDHKMSVQFPQTSFTKIIKEEDRIKKIQEEKSKQKLKEKKQKIIQFGEYVTENFKPRSNEKSQFIPKKKTSCLISLNHDERYNIGKNYLSNMRKVLKKKQQIKTNRETEQTTAQQFTNNNNPLKKSKYHDYLKDLKNSRKEGSKNNKKLENGLKNNTIDPQSAQKALQIIRKKQESLSYYKSQKRVKNQYEIAKDKLKLLNQLMKNV